MLPIYICDDNKIQLDNMKKIIFDIINSECLQGQIELVCVSQNPNEIINYLCNHQQQSLYFLDIDLGDNYINGLELGVKIRNIDPRGFIVIVTVHSEMTLITFRSKIEAMDFIEKDQPSMIPKRVRECIDRALELSYINNCDEKKLLHLRNKMNYVLSEILYIEAVREREQVKCK